MTCTKQHFTLAACALALTWALTSGHASAGFVSASANMGIFDLRISIDDPNAELLWVDEWFGTVQAYAQHSLSGSDSDYAEYLGNSGSIEAEAQAGPVESGATYEVASPSVWATTESGLVLGSPPPQQGDGFGNAGLDNFFAVSSLAPIGDTVEAVIQLNYSGDLAGEADAEGFFDIFAGAFLELYQVDQQTGSVLALLATDWFDDAASGSNTAYTNSPDGTLTITTELAYNDDYWLYAEADSEVYGAVTVVPLPGALPLFLSSLLFGTGAFAWRRRR